MVHGLLFHPRPQVHGATPKQTRADDPSLCTAQFAPGALLLGISSSPSWRIPLNGHRRRFTLSLSLKKKKVGLLLKKQQLSRGSAASRKPDLCSKVAFRQTNLLCNAERRTRAPGRGLISGQPARLLLAMQTPRRSPLLCKPPHTGWEAPSDRREGGSGAMAAAGWRLALPWHVGAEERPPWTPDAPAKPSAPSGGGSSVASAPRVWRASRRIGAAVHVGWWGFCFAGHWRVACSPRKRGACFVVENPVRICVSEREPTFTFPSLCREGGVMVLIKEEPHKVMLTALEI